MVERTGSVPEQRVERRRYNFLGLHVTFSSDRPETLALLDAIYGHFRNGSRRDPSGEELGLELTSARGPSPAVLEVTGQKHPLAQPPLTDVHAYSILLGELFQRLGDYFLVHGACVTDGEDTLLMTGPSGRGKTTLSLILLEHGFRILSDDLTPIGRRDGLVRPFPKRVGVKRDRDGLSAPHIGGARPVPLGDKWLLDPADLQGGLETEPRRLSHLLLLEPEGVPSDTVRSFRVAVVHGQEEFRRRLDGIAGVTARSIETPSGRSALDVEVASDPRALSEFYEACSSRRHQIIHFQSRTGADGFEEPPAIAPCPTLPAAVSVMRELLNRESNGALVNSVGGDLSPLLMELAGHLEGVRCARLRVGDRARTAELVASWVRSKR